MDIQLDHPAHHLVSIGTASVYVTSLLAQWSPVLTWSIGLVTLAWYAVLFYDRFKRKYPKN